MDQSGYMMNPHLAKPFRKDFVLQLSNCLKFEVTTLLFMRGVNVRVILQNTKKRSVNSFSAIHTTFFGRFLLQRKPKYQLMFFTNKKKLFTQCTHHKISQSKIQ